MQDYSLQDSDEHQDKVSSSLNRDDKDKMDRIVAKAQASIAKVKSSPFGRAVMQDGKNNSTGRANDSLEAMRNDFINDF